ncbi:protein virilizer [Prorops nasuta]|uniref:protein virilizer n=1 Tax=Prorops nasuta TaxID=863751 RepID=UPI0034CF54DC
MDNTELLFFDTFSHDISEELNLDLVQFPKPVYINEVRIIPLGARVQADFPGGVRLGATNPSQFEIEFFVNDLSKPGASTFESLGGLEYKQNVHIQLECERKQIPTDGLVLRGWYTTITLAVYGSLTKSLSSPQEIINSTTGSTAPTNNTEETVETTTPQVSEQKSDWYYENQAQTNSNETCATPAPPPPVQTAQPAEPARIVSEPTKLESAQWEGDTNKGQIGSKRPSSPSPESLVSLSPESISAEEEEANQDEDDTENVEPFEPILSDEDIMADDVPFIGDQECEDIQLDSTYDPNPPDLLEIEDVPNLIDDIYVDNETLEKLRELVRTISKSVLNFNNAPGQEKETFVHNCETLCTILGNFDITDTEFNDLMNITNAGLDMELARSQPQPAYKVRHVKVGVRLSEALCRLPQGPEILLKVEALSKLLNLCMKENVALPVKLSALRALDAALISPIVQEHFKTEISLYRNTLIILDTAKLSRLKYALSSLLRKIHIYQLLDEVKELNELIINELMNAYACAPTVMAQPKRQLPASSQMEFERELIRNPRRHILAYFHHHRLSCQLLLLLSSPNSGPGLIKVCRRFLLCLSDTKEGLFYLLRQPEITKYILRALRYEIPGIGNVIAWRLQVTLCLMQLKQTSDWIYLKKLHSFLIYSEGLQALTTVLTMNGFLDILIPYLSDQNLGEFSAEIISAVVRYSDHVEVFYNRAATILEKSRNHSVLRDIAPYLTVAAQASNWNYADVSPLVTYIRKGAETAPSLSGQMITACRILQYLIFPSYNDIDPMEPYIELKYRNALTQLFAADGLTALVTVMSNIAEFYKQPYLHRAALTGRRGLALVALLLPCIKLTRALLERLVKCMSTDFKDLTAVAPLLGVYCLVEAIPNTVPSRNLSDEIVRTLLVFTQAVDSDGSGNVAKSLWTQMLGEVLKMVSLSPCNFIPGLKLLTRLLPPILTCKEADKNEDISRIIGIRKLWSAHLQAQANNLTDTLRLLCTSWNKDLLMLLSEVCKQLSDLAAPTALLVGRCLLDGVIAAVPLEKNVLILALLSDLSKHASMKATLLTLTNPSSRAQVKSDQKYPPVIEAMCATLKNTNNELVQNKILDIFETLCDCNLSLMQQDANEPYEKQLTHLVPSKEPLLSILTALIEVLANSSKYQSNILSSAIHILLSLSSHNYGLYHVKSCLENNPDALRILLDHVTTVEEEDKYLIDLTVSLLDNLITSKTPNRTLHLHLQQLSTLISWSKNGHPLEEVTSCQELVENLKSIEEKEEKEPIPEMLEPLLPTPETLLSQFSQRSFNANPLKNSKTNSFVVPNLNQNENIVDLLALASELLPVDFNLLAEVQNLCSKTPPDDVTQPLSKTQNEEQDARSAPKQSSTTVTKLKQPFVTPMRGRAQFSNSMRGGPTGGGVGRGADPFRSRPPNTSRPPSLHVDDFVALETCGAQPTGPTGYNKLSIRGACPPRAINTGTRSRPWVQETRTTYLR